MAGVRHDVPISVAVEQIEFLFGVVVFADRKARKIQSGFTVHGVSSSAGWCLAAVENREADELRTVELVRNCHWLRRTTEGFYDTALNEANDA